MTVLSLSRWAVVELFVLISQQTANFDKAVREVEELHHRKPPGYDAESDPEAPVFALLDNDPELMKKVRKRERVRERERE